MKGLAKHKFANLKNCIAIIPIVLIVIVSFFLLIRNEIIKLSKERLSLIAEDYANDISTWAGGILNELEVYKALAMKEGKMDEHTFELLATSLGKNEMYPYGVYWGDKNGNFFDSSGWTPDPNFPFTERLWYTDGLNHINFEISEPYIDEKTGNSCVSASVRMFFDRVESVMAADIYLDYVSNMVNELTTQEIEHAFFITKKSRIIVADSDVNMVSKNLATIDDDLYQEVNKLIDRHFLGQTTLHANGSNYYVNINQIANTNWLFVTCMNEKVLNKKLMQSEFIMVFIGIVVSILLVLLTFYVTHKMNVADKKAKTDPLTGLLNRDGFRASCMKMIEDGLNYGVLLIMDMDNFKQVNDTLGHPEGDEVLKSFANLLKEYFNRSHDSIARIGGDEFAVFVGRQLNYDNIENMLDRFLDIFHEKYDEKYEEQQLSVSIGVAFVENCLRDYQKLYRHADDALYTAKQYGKDCFAFEK